MKDERSSFILHPSSLILLAVLRFLPLLAGWARVQPGDFSEEYWPLRLAVIRQIAQGQLPLWNPYIYAGRPALADSQSATLYPPALLTGLLSLPWGYPLWAQQWEAVAHYAVASVGAYLFARRRIGGQLAPWMAALAYGLGAYLTSYPLQQLPILEAVAWLPWLLLLMARIIDQASAPQVNRRSQLQTAVLLGVLLSMASVAGHPQPSIYVAYAFGTFTLWELVSKRVTLRHVLAPFALSALVAFGLGAGQILPTAALISRSLRTSMDYAFVSGGIAPNEMAAIWQPIQSGTIALYVGVVPLLLALLGLLYVRPEQRSAQRFWFGITVIALLLALGGQGPLYAIFYRFAPGFASFRNQERILVLWAWGMALLAAYGAAAWEAGRIPTPAALLAAVILAGIGLLVVQRSLNLATVLTLLAFLLAGYLLAAGVRWRNPDAQPGLASSKGELKTQNSKLLSAALILLTLVDLSSHTWGYGWGTVAQTDFSPTPLVHSLQRLVKAAGQPLRISSEGLLPNDGNGAILAQLQDFDGNSPVELISFIGFSRQVSETRALRLLNVGYIATQRSLPEGEVQLVDTVGAAHIYRLLGTLPRAYVVYNAQSVYSQQAAWQAANAADYNPAGRVVIEGDAPAALQAPAAPPTVEYLKQDAGLWQFRVRSAAAGLLVVAEVAEPGWQARVDGQTTAWLRADGVRIAIPIPAGEHLVDLSYRPLEALIGLAISGLTAIGLIVFWILTKRRRA